MGNELAALRTATASRIACSRPWARPVIDEGRRLAASYANYLIVNGAVLMPAMATRPTTWPVMCWPRRIRVARSCRCLAAR